MFSDTIYILPLVWQTNLHTQIFTLTYTDYRKHLPEQAGTTLILS